MPWEKQEYKYQQGKWTPKDILLHLTDTERIFAYRALKIVRGEGEDLKSFDQDVFVNYAKANKFDMAALLAQYSDVRQMSISLFKSFDLDQLELKGSVSGNLISARSLGFIILGHEMHHIEVIKERYL
ncbi:MAG: DinB family protein [Bacteroidota bacterium]